MVKMPLLLKCSLQSHHHPIYFAPTCSSRTLSSLTSASLRPHADCSTLHRASSCSAAPSAAASAAARLPPGWRASSSCTLR